MTVKTCPTCLGAAHDGECMYAHLAEERREIAAMPPCNLCGGAAHRGPCNAPTYPWDEL